MAQVHGLQAQARPGDRLPRREEALCQIRAARHERGHRLGGRTEQHHQAVTEVLLEHRPRGEWHAVHRTRVRGRHDPAQPRPAARGLCEQRDAPPRLGDMGAAADRCPTPPTARSGLGGRSDREVDPEDGPDAGGGRGLREVDRAGHGVPVGQRERRHPALDSTLHKRVGERGAVAGGVAGGDVQMSKSTAPHLLSPRVPPLTCDLSRYPPQLVIAQVFERVNRCCPRHCDVGCDGARQFASGARQACERVAGDSLYGGSEEPSCPRDV